MKIIYFSFTGSVRRFIKRIEPENTLETTAENCIEPVHGPFIIVTGIIGLGEVPEPVQSFLEINHQCIRGMAVSGNQDWGLNFAKAGRTMSEEYNVPLLMKFELHGRNKDAIEFKNKVGNFNENHGRKKVQSYWTK